MPESLPMPHLVIVDGHHLLYRAYWAIPRTMRTSRGEQVNIAFGLAGMLLMILKTEEPTHLLFCFDADEDTFRHKEYAAYKAGRAATPDDFYPQVPRALALLDACGVRRVAGGEFEADDYACSYAHAATTAGFRTTIVTGDRDLLQLSSDMLRVAIPHKGYTQPQYMDPAAVSATFGVTPAQIPEYKGLVGDASDNLPGIQGIGPKTAASLLQQYGTLEGIFDHLSEIRPAWRAKLEAGKDSAFFCRRMARLIATIPLPIPLQTLAYRDVSPLPMRSIFSSFEFSLLMRRWEAFLQTPYGASVFVSVPSATPSEHVRHTSHPSSQKHSDQLSLF